jgi:hypothetical protein
MVSVHDFNLVVCAAPVTIEARMNRPMIVLQKPLFSFGAANATRDGSQCAACPPPRRLAPFRWPATCTAAPLPCRPIDNGDFHAGLRA